METRLYVRNDVIFCQNCRKTRMAGAASFGLLFGLTSMNKGDNNEPEIFRMIGAGR